MQEHIKKAIASAIAFNELEMNDCRVTVEDLRLISEREDISSIESLRFYYNNIDHAGIKVIADWLHKLTSLKKLTIIGNSIDDAGAETLSDGLKNLRSLETLDLDWNRIGDAGVKALAGSLCTLTSLQYLFLKENRIGDAGAIALAACFNGVPRIRTLTVSENRIGNAGIEALTRCVGQNTKLDLRWNQVGWNDKQKQEQAKEDRLADALENDNIRAVEEILTIPGPPNINDTLHFVCHRWRISAKAVDWLIEKGADVNSRDRSGQTALHIVIQYGRWMPPGNEASVKKARLLVTYGADLTAIDGNGMTPIGIASYLGIQTAIALLSETSVRAARLAQPSTQHDQVAGNLKSPTMQREQSQIDGNSGGSELILDLGDRVTLKLVLIPAGKFLMGSPETESDRSDKKEVQHAVTISEPFYLGVTHVTIDQYAQFEKDTGKKRPVPRFKQTGDDPVVNVSWNDAQSFCMWLSKKTGETVDLPTEAQWEYACRAGTNTRFSFGEDDTDLDDYAWYARNSEKMTHPVGQKKPNAWGLYDMHGNVFDWCLDRYPAPDHYGPFAAGVLRLLRGGSYYSDPAACRSAFRGYIVEDTPDMNVGFRVAVAPRLLVDIKSLSFTKPKNTL